MRYLERFLAKVAGEKNPETPTLRTDRNDKNPSGPIEIFGNAQVANRQKRQKGFSSVLSVPHVGVSEKITIPAPVISAAVPLTSERDRLAAAYRSQLEAIGTLAGDELRAATERLLSLAKRIDTLSRPGRFDWQGLWAEVGVCQIETPRTATGIKLMSPMGDKSAAGIPAASPAAFIPDTLPTEPPAAHLARFGAAAIAEAFGAERAGELVAIAERFDKASAWDKPTIRAKFWAAWLSATKAAGGVVKLEARGETNWSRNPVTDPAREWDADTARRLAWLATVDPPAHPFRLDGARMASDPALFVARLRADAAQGPDGPRARNATFQGDLARFEALMTEERMK